MMRKTCTRFCLPSSAITKELMANIRGKWNVDAPKVATLKQDFGNELLGVATVNSAYGGMQDLTSLVYEPSMLDDERHREDLLGGIRFRGLSLRQCQEKLPKATSDCKEPLPEAMLWLLLTGKVPTQDQISALCADLHHRRTSKSGVDSIVTAKNALNALPVGMAPLSQFSSGVLALQHHSKFAAAYASGKANKHNYWELALDDSLDCIARSPVVAAMIYRRITTPNNTTSNLASELDPNLDLAANFSRLMGFVDPEFWDMMRLYISIHADHEGGNVSAHTTTLVGSTLADPYLSFSAGLNGLAGPLHGDINQEVIGFDFEMRRKCLEAGVDAKALDRLSWEGGAIPDVDYHAGEILLKHYGMKEKAFYPVLIGLGRQLGVLSGLVWDRVQGRPIERPKSTTSEALFKKFNIQ